MTQPPHRNKIIDFFRHDCWRKLVALFLALLLYLSIAPRTGEKHEKTFKDVPLDIELPAGLALVNNESRKVRITLSGNPNVLENIDPGELNIRAAVNADRVVPNEPYYLRLRVSDVKNLPYGVRVSSISPRELPLQLDQLIEKNVKVKAKYNLEKSFTDKYKLTDSFCIPDEVHVTGPAKLLEDRDEFSTVLITLNDTNHETFTSKNVSLNIPWGLSSSTNTVNVKNTIVTATTAKTFKVKIEVLYSSGQSNLKASLNSSEVEITLRGPQEQLNKLKDDAFSAVVRVDDKTQPGENTLPVNISFNTSISNNNQIAIISTKPKAVKAMVEIEQQDPK